MCVSHQGDVSGGCSSTHVEAGLPDRTTAIQGSGKCTYWPMRDRHDAKNYFYWTINARTYNIQYSDSAIKQIGPSLSQSHYFQLNIKLLVAYEHVCLCFSMVTYRATTKNWSICFSVSELFGSQIFSSSFSKSLPSSSPSLTKKTHTQIIVRMLLLIAHVCRKSL